MLNISNEEKLNAADRKSYVGKIYNHGKKQFTSELKQELNRLGLSKLDGYVYVHDLDAYGLTYNCLGFDITNCFPYKDFEGLEPETAILRVFDFMKELFAKVGNEQSGGMAIVNFDLDFSHIFRKLNIDFYGYEAIFRAAIRSMILWCNNMHTRMGQTSYYVSFNTGLGTDDFSRFLTSTLIEEFEKAGDLVFKPNIIFKVHEGINRFEGDVNYGLFQKALTCTSKKMIPTYLLCDCEGDKNTPPEKLSVMGCRSRVVANIHGIDGSIGRGNIANASINLPLIALDAINGKSLIDGFEFEKNIKPITVEEKYENLKTMWLYVANITTQILIDRWERTLNGDKSLFPTNHEFKLMCEDMNKVGVRETLKHGTLAIGFIGLNETIELITGKKYWLDDDAYRLAKDFVAFMRAYTDELIKKYKINFSLLATAGENISGVFNDYFPEHFEKHKMNENEFNTLQKGFLTNSFHVAVDSGVSAIDKLKFEGPFHKYANGGSISYLELGEAPLGNTEGLTELVETAVTSGVRYLGFNFPKDICNDCGTSGIFDACSQCGGKNITRIRRVSGYLEILDGFTKGKKAEEKNRIKN